VTGNPVERDPFEEMGATRDSQARRASAGFQSLGKGGYSPAHKPDALAPG